MKWIKNGSCEICDMVRVGHVTLLKKPLQESQADFSDPEDDRMTDSSLPMGSTSKTYDPEKDGNVWQRGDRGQNWSYSSSSSGQWRPRLRHEKDFSSEAGDTSDASNAVHHSEAFVKVTATP